ncbi:hypothetical protein IV203_029617 [Nitzschia inconspicua]|uniref:Uncharacterized protein n=1 Tax=Nitzschia inconspicua TaxID=303405 RepID=A0A9K3LRQ2_9STRA|nr:hypothetical protein IV203_029617 [Nitzschia inconspicua]
MATVHDVDKSMHDKLTVLIQTSPIPSHPSTALLEALFRSFRKADGLLESQIVILADGCEEITISAEGKVNEVENIKHGKASLFTAKNYREHLTRLREKVAKQTPPFCPLPGGSIKLLELEGRHGSALAIQAGMNQVVNTPLVMVCQHDNFFVRYAPLREVVNAMLTEPRGLGIGLNCLHFLSTATLNYQQKVKRRYNLDLEPVTVEGLQYPLVPLVFWYGRSHLTYSDYVRSYALNRPLEQGSHLEELLGEKQLHDILKRGVEAHKKYGTYVLNQGVEVLYHLSGRRVIACQETNHFQLNEANEADISDNPKPHHQEAASPLEGSFTTARFCRAIVPGLRLISDKLERDKNHLPKQFKQRCFQCGEKGDSKKLCPQRTDSSNAPLVEVIRLC